jgi:hypothetical protein
MLKGFMEKAVTLQRSAIFIIATLVVFFCFTDVAYAGFGITPPYVRNSVLRPGSEFTQEIIIVRSDPVEDLNAEITINVPGIEQWFAIDKGLQFLLPKGEKTIKMNVTVRVPQDADLGPRTGNIRIRTFGNELPSSGVSLALGAQIDVSLDVVEQIYDFKVQRVELPDTEEGRTKWWLDFPGKLKFAMYIENTGNVPAAPENVTFDLYDTGGLRLIESTKYANTLKKILPFNTEKIVAEAPITVPPGAYRVKYKIYKQGDIIAQSGELALSVLPKGTIPGYQAYGFVGLSRGDQLTIIIPATLLLMALLWFFVIRKKNERRPRRKTPREVEDSYDDDPPGRSTPSVEPRKRAPSSGVVDLSRRR